MQRSMGDTSNGFDSRSDIYVYIFLVSSISVVFINPEVDVATCLQSILMKITTIWETKSGVDSTEILAQEESMSGLCQSLHQYSYQC